jgi:hypothetical protein
LTDSTPTVQKRQEIGATLEKAARFFEGYWRRKGELTAHFVPFAMLGQQ